MAYYQLNYFFNEAILAYNTFKRKGGIKLAVKMDLERQIETAENGRLLLSSYSELIVYEKTEVDRDKFFRLYDQVGLEGSILVANEFQSKKDKKMGHVPLVFFPKNADQIYFSSYGEEGLTGLDIYEVKKDGANRWGKPVKLSDNVNTKYDEDYPFLTSDKTSLYFSSKGHNSMGGYDIFIATSNSTGFSIAENMDFAISSPDDDLMFIVDNNNEFGYFASARQSQLGKLFVYKISVNKVSTQLSIIAGMFNPIGSEVNERLIVKVLTPKNKTIGVFESDENKQIVLIFPKGGQYKYLMSIDGGDFVTEKTVSIPQKDKLTPLRQSFTHVFANGKDEIRLVDKYDEQIENADLILAEVFTKRAALIPNSHNFEITTFEKKPGLEELYSKEIGSSEELSLSSVYERLKNNSDLLMKSISGKKAEIAVLDIELSEEKKNIELFEAQILKLFAKIENEALQTGDEDNLAEAKRSLDLRAYSKAKIREITLLKEITTKEILNQQKLLGNGDEFAKSIDRLGILIENGELDLAQSLMLSNQSEFQTLNEINPFEFSKTNETKSNELKIELSKKVAVKRRYEANLYTLEENIKSLEERKPDAKRKEALLIESEIEEYKIESAFLVEEIGLVDNKVEKIQFQLKILDGSNRIFDVSTFIEFEDDLDRKYDKLINNQKLVEENKLTIAQSKKDNNESVYASEVIEVPKESVLLTEYSEQISDLEPDLSLDLSSTLKKKSALDQLQLTKLDNRIQEIDSLLKRQSNDQLLAEKDQLLKEKKAILIESRQREEVNKLLVGNSENEPYPILGKDSSNAQLYDLKAIQKKDRETLKILQNEIVKSKRPVLGEEVYELSALTSAKSLLNNKINQRGEKIVDMKTDLLFSELVKIEKNKVNTAKEYEAEFYSSSPEGNIQELKNILVLEDKLNEVQKIIADLDQKILQLGEAKSSNLGLKLSIQIQSQIGLVNNLLDLKVQEKEELEAKRLVTRESNKMILKRVEYTFNNNFEATPFENSNISDSIVKSMLHEERYKILNLGYKKGKEGKRKIKQIKAIEDSLQLAMDNRNIIPINKELDLLVESEKSNNERGVDSPLVSYNKVLGSAPASPIESRLGLFFTVQIAVFNEPVSRGLLLNIEPLLTIKLPTGQIRYSTGIYNDMSTANEKRIDVIKKGIKDAFVTAYYNGERITLRKANSLLAEFGEKLFELPTKEEISLDPIYGVKVVKKQPALTSSKGVDEDTVSNKILQEVDTVYLSKEEVMNLSTENDLKIILVKSSLSSELANFILRVNYKKSYLNQEGSMFVILHDVPITEQELIKKQIKKMQSNY